MSVFETNCAHCSHSCSAFVFFGSGAVSRVYRHMQMFEPLGDSRQMGAHRVCQLFQIPSCRDAVTKRFLSPPANMMGILSVLFSLPCLRVLQSSRRDASSPYVTIRWTYSADVRPSPGSVASVELFLLRLCLATPQVHGKV